MRTVPFLILALAQSALAQDQPAVAPVIAIEAEQESRESTPTSSQLDDIVVTAERRVQSLQSTPISMEAFNAAALEQRGIDGLHDLGSQVPNLTVEPFPTHNATLRLFIRGIGIQDAQLTQDPAVGLYLDGVYIARSVGLALDIADLERIEVLRGPQGTLYGRNTTGGAINLITRRPDPGVFWTSHKLQGATRHGWVGKSSINVPMGNELAVKFALLGSVNDGFVENTGDGGDFGDRQQKALRVDLRWTGLDWLTADYAYDYSNMKYYNYMFQAYSLPTTNKGQAELFKPYAVAQSRYSTDRLRDYASSAPMEESGTRIGGHAFTLAAPVGNHEIKYLGSIRDLTDREYADLGGGAGSQTYRLDSHRYDGPAADVANGGPTPLVVPTVTQQQVSHELQLLGSLFDGSVEYVAGLFHFRESGTEDRHHLNHQLSTAADPQQLDAATQNMPPDQRAAILALGSPRLVNFVDFWWSIDNTATAAFTQATWTPGGLQERLHLTLGYRHSEDERKAVKYRVSDTYIEGDNNGQGSAELLSSAEFFDYVPAARTFSDDAVSGVIAFDVAPGFNTYLKSSEAYKSGGFNVRDPNQSGATEAEKGDTHYGFGFVEGFRPEYVESWELGAKTEWWDRRLRLNADVFYNRFRDMQTNFLVPGTISDTKSRNAGRARMRGVEVDLTARVLPDVTVSADYAFLDADVTEVIDNDGNNIASLFPFPFAPKRSWVAAVDAGLWQGSWGELRGHLSWHYTGYRQGLVIVEERRGLTAIPAYGLLNARLSAGPFRIGERGTLDVAMWGKNLTDKKYPVMAIDNLPQANTAVVWGEPIAAGLEATYRFQ